MMVQVITPTAVAQLYAPTQVVRTGNHIRVDIYPTGGLLQVLDSITVSTPLGTLEVGDYTYELHLHPAWPVGWGTTDLQGTFRVLPKITLSQAGTNFVLRRPASATDFVLETVGECSAGQWTAVTDGPVRIGNELVATNSSRSTRQFFRLRKR